MDIKGFRNKFLFLINAVNEEVAAYVQRYCPRLFLNIRILLFRSKSIHFLYLYRFFSVLAC